MPSRTRSRSLKARCEARREERKLAYSLNLAVKLPVETCKRESEVGCTLVLCKRISNLTAAAARILHDQPAVLRATSVRWPPHLVVPSDLLPQNRLQIALPQRVNDALGKRLKTGDLKARIEVLKSVEYRRPARSWLQT